MTETGDKQPVPSSDTRAGTIGIGLVIGAASLFSLAAFAFYLMPTFQGQHCDSSHIISGARALLAGADSDKLNANQTAWSEKNVQFLVSNESKDSTGRHLTCTVRVSVEDDIIKGVDSLASTAISLASAAGNSIIPATLHYSVTAESDWQSWHIFFDPQNEEEKSNFKVVQALLVEVLPPRDATNGSPHDFRRYVGQDMCERMHELDNLDQLKDQFSLMFGMKRWDEWTGYAASCATPIQSVTDSFFGTLVILQRHDGAYAPMNGAMFVRTNGRLAGVCLSDGKTSEWRGPGWVRNGDADECSLTPEEMLEKLRLGRT